MKIHHVNYSNQKTWSCVDSAERIETDFCIFAVPCTGNVCKGSWCPWGPLFLPPVLKPLLPLSPTLGNIKKFHHTLYSSICFSFLFIYTFFSDGFC